MATAILTAASTSAKLLIGEKEPSIDNWTFRLFYKCSTALLILGSFIVSSNQFFGEPIQCDLPGGGVSDGTLKTYCWMYSSFNIPESFQGKCARKRQSEDVMYNSYYQWVSLCLVGQAVIFYIPRAIWLSLEGGLMKHLAKDKGGKIVEDYEEKCDELLYTFNQHLRNKYDRYYYGFVACEALNVFIVVCQLLLTNNFLGGYFMTYGADVYRFYSLPPEELLLEDARNPMCEAFPRVASCTYYQYGSGGKQSSLNALCILALNIIIDKVYLVLWFWYILLIVCGSARLLIRIGQISVYFRYRQMELRMHRYFKKDENLTRIKQYLSECSVGDWFVLYQMSKNMNKRLFFVFLSNLSKVSRKQMLQALLPQMRAVQAFKRSLKKPKEVKVAEKKKESPICNIPPPPQYKSDEGSEKSSSPEKKTRRHEDDVAGVEDECRFIKPKKSKTQETFVDNESGSSNEDENMKVAFQKTFGKLKKFDKSRISKNK